MNYEIITVATKEQGLFNELINNKFNVNITVLGMGMKWTGFKMKYELVYNYIKNMDDNKIIIFVDGFDSEINKHPDIAVNLFKQNNYKILFSKQYNGNNIIFKNILNKIFYGKYGDNHVANSGLYMGYIKYIKPFLFNLNNTFCNDDQVVTNKNLTNDISIDINNEIFHNFSKNIISDAIFVSHPGTLSIDRIIKRGIMEYTQFFIKYFYLLIIISNYFILKFDKYELLPINVYYYYIYMKMDKSCIT